MLSMTMTVVLFVICTAVLAFFLLVLRWGWLFLLGRFMHDGIDHYADRQDLREELYGKRDAGVHVDARQIHYHEREV